MACYIVLIGGTGHRVGKAIVHLAAAGAIPAAELKIMCADSDGGNKDLALLKDLIEKYRKLNSSNLFNTKISTKNDKLDELCWSPLTSMESMETILEKPFMDNNSGKKLLDFLYTGGYENSEQTTPLIEGFYGHTSIGSLFMADQMMESQGDLTPDWDAFLTNIKDGDTIFVVGSAFGGTGASGVPTLSRIIKDYRPSVKISAVLVMPYFKFKYQNDGIIDWTAFTTKTKAAMSFYDKQNFDRIFKTLYIIGEDMDQFMNVKYSKGGNDQVNVPNAIELCAATALIDFLRECAEDGDGNDSFAIKLMSRDEEPGTGLLVSQQMLNRAGGASECFNHLAKLFKFSVMYTKYYYHHLKNGKANGAWADKYKGITEEQYQTLYAYCMLFITWMKAIHSTTDADGMFENSVNKYVRLFRFSKDYENLFDGSFISRNFMGEKRKELDAISTVIWGQKTAKRGEELITDFNNAKPVSADSPFTSFYRTLLEICNDI